MTLEVTDGNIDEILKNNETAVITFKTSWCGPCKSLTPVLEDLAKEMTGMVIGKVDAEMNPESALKYEIRGVPNTLFFKNGEVVKSHMGMIQKSKLQEMIKEFLN
jgi:thioredoxin 1